MDRLKSFICYADEENHIAEELNSCLTATFGFDSFFAKKSIIPSKKFIPTILSAIKETDLFFALISNNSKQSSFANQEMGMAIALDKTMVSIMLNVDSPCGFLSERQGIYYKDYDNNSFKLAMKLFYYCIEGSFNDSIKEKAHNSIIYSLQNNTDFSITRPVMKLMTHIKTFNKAHLNTIRVAIRTNRAVNQEQFAFPDFKKFLLKTYQISIDS